jgi:catechol 2,3-dioxygenase-like lactoylglutathione lyase family enzyme
MRIRGLAWLGVVSDRPETRAFYREALGLEQLAEDASYAYLKIDERARLEVLASDTQTARRHRPGAPVFGFLVDDVEAALDEVRAKGYPVEGTIHEWRDDTEVHRWTYLQDPEGHILQLVDVRRSS